MSDFRDIQHGVNDPVGGVDVKQDVNKNETPHERAQHHADVRAKPTPQQDASFVPEGLRRPRADPLNRRTGRHRTG
jgi:hypothetical protein